MAQDAGAPGRPPRAIPDAQLRRLLECPSDRALVAEELEAGLQTWHGRLRPGEAAAVPVAAGGRLLLKGPAEHTSVTLPQAAW
eukprot:5676070-Alexandrium_andersonii.AAC.1